MGTLFQSRSGADPGYYRQKRKAEREKKKEDAQ